MKLYDGTNHLQHHFIKLWHVASSVLLICSCATVCYSKANQEHQKVEPVILSSPSNVTTLIDHVPVSMQCAVDGEPFPVVTWQQRLSSIETWRSVRSHLTGRYRLSKSGQRLEFRKLLMSDVGFYRCVARNLLGQVFSDPAFLDVHAAVEIIDPGPQSNVTTVLWGTELRLRCIAVGVPVPHATWSVNGQQIIDATVELAATHLRLDVLINATQSALYVCQAQNRHIKGHSSATATVYINVIDIQSDTSDGSLAAGAQVLDQTFTSNPLLIAVVMGTVVTAVLLVVVTTVLCCRFCRPKLLIVAGRDAIIAAGTKPHSLVAPANFEIDIDKLPSNAIYCQKAESTGDSNLKSLECNRNDLCYVRDIACGAFGQIFEATAVLQGHGPSVAVAVKVLKPDDADLEQEFLQMAGVLADLSGGPNIINLLGVCLTSHPYCLVLEYASAGDLHRFLRDAAPDHFIERWRRSGSHRSSYYGGRNASSSYRLSVVQLADICRQIAVGMSYVAEHCYVHRDLAARNCLVSVHSASSSSHRVDVKIADFVLARRMSSSSTGSTAKFYEGTDSEEIAIRWAAVEAILDARFSEASDVWSFGVTMWEVFSYASRPYGDIDSTPDVIRRVVAGRLLDRPDETPDCVYELMSSCWALDPSKRPTFASLVTSFGTIKQRLKH